MDNIDVYTGTMFRPVDEAGCVGTVLDAALRQLYFNLADLCTEAGV